MFLAPRAFIMKVQSIAVAELVNDPANVRKHSGKNLDAIKGSLARFGQQKPIVVGPDGVVVAGNGTLEAAKALGWKKIDAVKTGLKGSDRTAFAIADNRTSELAEWDDAALAEQLSALAIDDEELLAAAGFDEAELEKLISETIGLEDIVEDEAPEPPADPVTKAGDLWTLGEHRVLCGDCRIPSDVSALLGGTKINVAFTSPPYASQRKYDESSGFKPIRPGDYVEWFEAVQANVAEHLADDGSWFVNIKEAADDGWKQSYVKRLVLRHVDDWEWGWVEEYCWPRPALPLNPNMSRRFKNGWESVYHFATARNYYFAPGEVRHESDGIFSYADQKAAGKMVGGTTQGIGGGIMSPVNAGSGMAFPSNVLSNMGGARVVGHSAAFPVALPVFFVKAFSREGGSVFDPFLGSGTTLIAAEQLGRKCYGIEISPAYCDVIVERWQNLTGKKAKRVANGKSA